MERWEVDQWVTRYEQAWRTEGTDPLGDLFAPAITYSPSPWALPLQGLGAVAEFWEAERDTAEEPFTFEHEVVAVEGRTAVVRVRVEYADPAAGVWRDLWVIGLGADGRCVSFEEWPFAPSSNDGHQPP